MAENLIVENLGDRERVGYFDDLINAKVDEGDFEFLAPGVTRVTLPDSTNATFLHLSVFHPLDGVPPVFGIEIILGLIMASYHFNNRIATVVPRLAELGSCDIKFSMDIFDTQSKPTVAAKKLVKNVLPRRTSNNVIERRKYPTAIIGGQSSSTSELLAIMGGVEKLTQISFSSSANTLDNKGEYPYFTRVVSPASGISSVAADFFVQRLDTSHVFVIYRRDAFGSDLFRFFEKRANDLGITTRSASISADLGCSECQDRDIASALNTLEQSGYAYIYAILTGNHYTSMLPIAMERGLAGPGKFWMYVETFAFPAQESDSPLLAATHGSAVLGLPQGPLFEAYDAFTEEWTTHISTSETRMLFERLLPADISQSDLFQEYEIPTSSDFTFGAYDSFMSLALAACDTAAIEGEVFSESRFLNTLRNLDFRGATGQVRFNNETGSRDQATSVLKIANVLADRPLDSDGKVPFRNTNSFLYQGEDGGSSAASWKQILGATFIYSDNTTVAPLNLPPLVLQNEEIHVWATVVGYVACTIIVSVAAAFCVWMQRNIKTDPVRSAQPFFVRIVVLGIVLMGLSLIPQAALASSSVPDMCCMVIPWLLAIGFCFTFAALFSRLIRINKIDDSSRRLIRIKIKPTQVVVPFLILLALNVAILTTWTIMDPLQYRMAFDGNLDEYGRSLTFTTTCQSDAALYFRAALGLLDITALALTGYHGYKARNVKVAYKENVYILYGLIASSQSFLVGLPLVAAVDTPSASFFCRTLAILWGCFGIALPLLGPKICQVHHWKAEQKAKEARKQERIKRANEYFANVSNQGTGRAATKSTNVSSMQQSTAMLDYSSQPG